LDGLGGSDAADKHIDLKDLDNLDDLDEPYDQEDQDYPNHPGSTRDWLGLDEKPSPSQKRQVLLEDSLKNRKKPREKSKGGGLKGTKALSIPKKRGILWKLFWGAFWFFLGIALLVSVTILVVYIYFSQDLPSVVTLKNYQPKTVTFFYAVDGRVIGEFSHERRIPVSLAQMPMHLREAFLAVEDTDFYRHQGVNLKAVARAAYNNFKGEDIQGGSTITQQLVRSLLLTSERKISRKIREMILAFRLESSLTKDQILELYLNQIYLGQGAYGVEAAAQEYFDKHVEQLTVAESAMLAGITQSPEGKNPLKKPEEARSRQLHAIGRMEYVGFLTPEEANAARGEVLNIRGHRPNPNTTIAPYFTEHVRRLMVEKYGEESVYNDGYRVYTTLDIRDQQAADAAVARGLWEYARRRGFKGPINHYDSDEAIAAALSAYEKKLPAEGLDPYRLYEAVILEVQDNSLSVRVGPYIGTIEKKDLDWILPKGSLSKQLTRGDVVWVRVKGPSEEVPLTESRELALARIGAGQEQNPNKSFVLEQTTDVQAALLSMDLRDGGVRAMVGGRDFSESQYNRATQSQRQPGSSFKPIVYTSAMDNGFTPGSIMVDGPVVVDDIGSGKRWKPMNSDGKFLGPMTLYSALVASRNLVSVKVLERIGFDALDKTASDMGITAKLPRSLAVALGAHGITMPEMIGAYSSFPNQGARVVPRYITRIEDRYGNVLETFDPVFYQAISPPTACILTFMLRGAVAQGTGSAVKPLDRPVGGKTGTTNDYSDAWFVGFTPEYVTAVWMGTDELKPRGVGEVGGRAAAPIFLYYMQKVLTGVPITDFTVPEGATLESGGAFGICYKEGTVGTGISENTSDPSPEEDFMRNDMENFGDEPLVN
jgi:penicillin-binding protein 1A